MKNFKNQISDKKVRAKVNRHPQIKQKKVLKNKTPFITNNICA